MRFMKKTGFIAISFISVGAAVLLTAGIASLRAQGPGGGQAPQALFTALDTDKDGTLTRAELESGFQSWFTAWDTTHSGTLTQPQILAGISTLLPPPPAVKPGQANTFNPAGNSTPIPVSQAAVDAMKHRESWCYRPSSLVNLDLRRNDGQYSSYPAAER
jgi:hypothetical protein